MFHLESILLVAACAAAIACSVWVLRRGAQQERHRWEAEQRRKGELFEEGRQRARRD